MHELAVTQQLLGLAVRYADQAGGGRVTDLHVVIGDLSTFCEDSVTFAWEYLARETPCEGARLHFRRIPAELTCLDCGGHHTLQGEPVPCPYCSSSRLRVTAGDGLMLESIEVDTETPTFGH